MNSYLGEIRLFAGNYAPDGWMLCQGQILSTKEYQALFSLLGSRYGGNGVRTFALPDLRSRVPVGCGQTNVPGLTSYTLAQTIGAESVTLQSTHLPLHTHAVQCNSTASNSNQPVDNFPAVGQVVSGVPTDMVYATTTDNTHMNAGVVLSAGAGAPINVVQPSYGMNYIICTRGQYPDRQY